MIKYRIESLRFEIDSLEFFKKEEINNYSNIIKNHTNKKNNLLLENDCLYHKNKVYNNEYISFENQTINNKKDIMFNLSIILGNNNNDTTTNINNNNKIFNIPELNQIKKSFKKCFFKNLSPNNNKDNHKSNIKIPNKENIEIKDIKKNPYFSIIEENNKIIAKNIKELKIINSTIIKEKEKKELFENNINNLILYKKNELYALIQQESKYYLKLLKQGYDNRKTGLRWIINKLKCLNISVTSLDFPSFLSNENIDFILDISELDYKRILIFKKLKKLKEEYNIVVKGKINIHDNQLNKDKILSMIEETNISNNKNNKNKDHNVKNYNKMITFQNYFKKGSSLKRNSMLKNLVLNLTKNCIDISNENLTIKDSKNENNKPITLNNNSNLLEKTKRNKIYKTLNSNNNHNDNSFLTFNKNNLNILNKSKRLKNTTNNNNSSIFNNTININNKNISLNKSNQDFKTIENNPYDDTIFIESMTSRFKKELKNINKSIIISKSLIKLNKYSIIKNNNNNNNNNSNINSKLNLNKSFKYFNDEIHTNSNLYRMNIVLKLRNLSILLGKEIDSKINQKLKIIKEEREIILKSPFNLNQRVTFDLISSCIFGDGIKY